MQKRRQSRQEKIVSYRARIGILLGRGYDTGPAIICDRCGVEHNVMTRGSPGRWFML
jgi:hypothetical protein